MSKENKTSDKHENGNDFIADVSNSNFSRESLISICERAVVDVSKWGNRDSPSSQESVGKLWALLKSNCQFEVLYENDGLCTNDNTIWLRVWSPKFSHFDWDGFDLNDRDTMEDETFYLPTTARLDYSDGNDWY